VLLGAGLFLSSSIGTVFKMFPQSVLGVILFMTGLQLALGSRRKKKPTASWSSRRRLLRSGTSAGPFCSAFWLTTHPGAEGCAPE
jgi:predicted permease